MKTARDRTFAVSHQVPFVNEVIPGCEQNDTLSRAIPSPGLRDRRRPGQPLPQREGSCEKIGRASLLASYGQITGTVTDPSGAVVPGAKVTVTNQETLIAREVSTSARGVFNVPNLNVGTYRVRITVTGFTTYERGGLILSANQVINVDATLALGATETVTEVTAASPAINTETSALADVKTNRDLEQLPLEMTRHLADKGFYTYAFLTTGTSSVTTTSLPVINGVRTQSGTLPTMDGIAVTA